MLIFLRKNLCDDDDEDDDVGSTKMIVCYKEGDSGEGTSDFFNCKNVTDFMTRTLYYCTTAFVWQ